MKKALFTGIASAIVGVVALVGGVLSIVNNRNNDEEDSYVDVETTEDDAYEDVEEDAEEDDIEE